MVVTERKSSTTTLTKLIDAIQQEATNSRFFKKDSSLIGSSVACLRKLPDLADDHDVVVRHICSDLANYKTILEQCNASLFLRTLWYVEETRHKLEGSCWQLHASIKMLLDSYPVAKDMQVELMAALKRLEAASFEDCRSLASQGVNVKSKMEALCHHADQCKGLVDYVLGLGDVTLEELHQDLAWLKRELELKGDASQQDGQYLEAIATMLHYTETFRAGGEACLRAKSPIPEDLLCPITRELLKDPVVLVETGHTYEREAIQQWLNRGNMTDPCTGRRISSRMICPNHALRKLAVELLRTLPSWRRSLSLSREPSLFDPDPAELELDQVQQVVEILPFPVEVVKCHDHELRSMYWLGTPLVKAAAHNRVDFVEVLLGSHITPQDLDTAVCWAAMADAVEILEVLLDKGAGAEALFVHNTVSSFSPAVRKRVGISQSFLDRMSEQPAENLHLATPLHLAALNNSINVAKVLLDRGANLEARNIHRATALHLAAMTDSQEVAQLLVEHRADTEAKTVVGATPLHMAALKNSARVAKVLMENGAELGAKAYMWGSPMEVANQNNSTDVIKVFRWG